MAKERADINDWGLASADDVARARPIAIESLFRRCPVMNDPVV
jgi:hypothetical protein